MSTTTIKKLDPNLLEVDYNVELVLTGPNGQVKDRREVHNVVTTAAKQALLSASVSKTIKDFAYIAVGTGTTAASAGQTALVTESARAAGTLSNPDANTFRNTYTFAAGTATGAITEAGLFDASTSGTMFNRTTFSAVNKGADDTLAVTVNVTMS